MTNLERKTYKNHRSLHKKGPFGIFLQKIEASQDLEILKIVKDYQDKMFVNEYFFREIASRKRKMKVSRDHPDFCGNNNCRYEDDPIYEILNSENIETLVEDGLKKPVAERQTNNGGFSKKESSRRGRKKPKEEMEGEDPANLKAKVTEETKHKVFGPDLKHSKELDKLLEDPTIYQRNTILNYYLFKKLDKPKKKELSRLFRKRYDVQMPNKFFKNYLEVKKPEKLRKSAYLHWLNDYLINCLSEDILKLSSFEIALLAGDKWNSLPKSEKESWYKLSNKWMMDRGRFQDAGDQG